MNLYTNVAALKASLGITGTTHDAVLLATIESASRLIDEYTHRTFYVSEGTRYFDTQWHHTTQIEDCLGISSLQTDTQLDATFDGETLVEGTDYYLWPDNTWPKLQIRTLQGGVKNFGAPRRRYIKAVGTWGYGDGLSNDPWQLETVTGTVATASGTTLTLSGTPGNVDAGSTIRLGDEQMYVTARTGTSVTIVRGVNGTTATAHTSAPVYYAKYPAMIVQAVTWLSSLWFNERQSPGLRMQMIGEYQEQRGGGLETDRMLSRLLGSFVL